MATYLTNDTDLEAVAGAIRTKGGTSGQLVFPQGFVDAIDAIETGGGGEWTTDGIANGSQPSGLLTVGVSSIHKNAFYQRSGITGMVLENACTLNETAIYGCNAMTFFVSHSTTTIAGQSCLAYNTGLLKIDINTPSLAKSLCIGGNSKLQSLILRKTGSITTMAQSNSLNSSATTAKPLHVYVPSALKSTYEAATNWSTWVADGKVIFEDLEGSAFESEDWWKS